jgi:hypothetical protein
MRYVGRLFLYLYTFMVAEKLWANSSSLFLLKRLIKLRRQHIEIIPGTETYNVVILTILKPTQVNT